MPTPRNHIRFSLTLALGIIAGAYLYWEKFYLKYRWEPKMILGVTAFLFVFIHLLSVRSGLACLYMAIICLSARHVYLTRNYWIGFGVLLFLLLAPVVAYYTIPSFKAKIAYVKYDRWIRANDKPGEDYSDSARLVSLKIGMQIGNEHPLVGIGAGNLKPEVYRRYAELYPEVEEPKMPHNQFVSVYAGTGIIGLLLFLVAFLYPLFYNKNYRNPLFLGFHVIVFTSFLAENTIENSIGVAFYASYLLLGLNYLSRKDSNE